MEHVLCRTSTSATFAKAIGYSHSEPSAIPLTWAGFNATLSDKNCRTTTGVVVPILNVPPTNPQTYALKLTKDINAIIFGEAKETVVTWIWSCMSVQLS